MNKIEIEQNVYHLWCWTPPMEGHEIDNILGGVSSAELLAT